MPIVDTIIKDIQSTYIHHTNIIPTHPHTFIFIFKFESILFPLLFIYFCAVGIRDVSAWPDGGQLLLLKLSGIIFPASDLRHPVMSSIMLLVGEVRRVYYLFVVVIVVVVIIIATTTTTTPTTTTSKTDKSCCCCCCYPSSEMQTQ